MNDDELAPPSEPTTRWFGDDWGAPICQLTPAVPRPNIKCHLCMEPIVEGDRGLVMPFMGSTEGIPAIIHEEGLAQVACHLLCFKKSVLPLESLTDDLEKDLEELETTNPEVRKAREDYERTRDEIIAESRRREMKIVKEK